MRLLVVREVRYLSHCTRNRKHIEKCCFLCFFSFEKMADKFVQQIEGLIELPEE